MKESLFANGKGVCKLRFQVDFPERQATADHAQCDF